MGKVKDLIVEQCETIFDDELMKRIDTHSKKWYVSWTDRVFPNGIAGYRAWHSIKHPWLIIEHCWEEIVFAWQRVYRGWDDSAVWSIDWYLAKLIPQLMRELAKTTHGTPIDMYPEGTFDDNGDCEPEQQEEAIKKWHDILEKIAVGFDIYHEHEQEVYYKEEFKKPFEEAFDLFRKHFGSFWD